MRLVISVDCGIRGVGSRRSRARRSGSISIITDHHEPDTELPAAFAVINPKRHDCSYPDKNLAGVGVALKLVQALCARTGHTNWLPAFVKVAAIGTLADVVPLTGENRIIAKLGLGMLSKGPHKVGLRALLDVCGLTGKEIDSYHIGFVVAPRVNAAGRMSTPDIAARLLLASDETMGEEARGWPSSSIPRTCAASRKKPRSSRRRRRSSRPTSRSAPAPSSSSPAKAGIAASSASSPPSSSTRFIVRRS